MNQHSGNGRITLLKSQAYVPEIMQGRTSTSSSVAPPLKDCPQNKPASSPNRVSSLEVEETTTPPTLRHSQRNRHRLAHLQDYHCMEAQVKELDIFALSHVSHRILMKQLKKMFRLKP